MNCRHCSTALSIKVLDLDHAPPSNAYLSTDQLSQPETHYPLRLFFCSDCYLVQTEDFRTAGDLFDPDYVYFSSTSRSWVEHAKRFSNNAMSRFDLSNSSFVVEIASNDGYLLQNFVAADIPCLGFEPTTSTANVARAKDVDTRLEFFSETQAKSLRAERADQGADLIVGNNVYAHVPDINDFTRGMAHLLAPEGVISLEFPHLQELVKHGQFDTVYHEHFSYLSLTTVMRIFKSAGLRVFDVDSLPTHGGSLRVWGCLADASHHLEPSVDDVSSEEHRAGIDQVDFYTKLQQQANQAADALVAFLVRCRSKGETVAAYGAAAKGTTLLNYARIDHRLLRYVADAAPFKQGRYLPGCHIPVVSPKQLQDAPPDHLLILPWNLRDEIAADLAWICAAHDTTLWTVMPRPEQVLPPGQP
ncbi:MAG: methyltransferase domain-containing protein [Rhodobacteraceae bacterium]|nr:methyltransferase domain-containing protein [Paracoccaceae bacterium]